MHIKISAAEQLLSLNMSVTSSIFEREKGTEVDVMELVLNPDVIVNDLKFFQGMNLDDDVPNIQSSSCSINVEISSAHNAFADHQGYFTTFAQEMDFIAKMENLAEKGQVLINVLYTYRSVSQAIPEISMDLPHDASAEQQAEATAKRSEINRKVLDILRPEIVKVKELIAYLVQAVSLFHSVITHLANKEVTKEIVPEGIHLSLLKLMDVMLILDNLKDIKTCLQKDFSRYKRVVGAHPSIEILEEVTQLQTFLSNPDPRKAKNYVFLSLRDEVKRVNGHENVFLDGLEFAINTLEKGFFVTPEEQFRLLRVLPYYILIADGEADDAKSFNIFKTTKIKLPALQKLFKKYPVVPLFADMNIVLELILHRSVHYNVSKLGSSWGNSDSLPNSVPSHYDLRSGWAQMRDSYSQYTTRFSAALNRYEKYPFSKTLDEVGIDMSASAYALVTDGLQLITRWSAGVKLMLCWKYTHPSSLEQVAAFQAEQAGVSDGAAASITTGAAVEGSEYARVLRYNLSKEELSVLIDAISMIKSLGSLMMRAEATLAPYVRFHIHHRIQTLVQGELTPLLHRLDKRNKPILPTLLAIRALVADWVEGSDPLKDYKEYTRKQTGDVKVKHPPRVVGPAASQLFILRTQLSSLCDSGSELRRKTSIFGKADLEKAELELFQRFYTDSFHYTYALNYVQVLSQTCDLSELWFREHYLEMTRCIQFPIEMSLPWILTEHLLLKHVSNEPLLESVLFILDAYNDAAHKSLYVLNQQYMYDEIEAEANLVIDQLYFLLSDEVYTHYKNLAASTQVDMMLKNKLEVMKGVHLSVDARRLESLLSQRHIQLLGRSINFSFILGQNINNKIYRDIDFAIKRFEASDARAVIELKTLLDIISATHARLSQFLALDSFETMLSEVNESFSPSSFRGRISLHMLSSLAKDIFPNYSYNMHTHRFIPSPIAIRPMQYSKAPKQSAVANAFGSVCGKVFEMCARLTRSFFGQPHIEAYIGLGLSLNDLSMLIDQCMKNMFDKILDVSEYLAALKDGIPPCAPPKAMFAAFQTVGGYGYYEGKLRSILDYDDLKPEVFQNFREIGNSLAFLSDLSDSLEVSDQFNFLMLAPFLGRAPAGSSAPSAGASASSGSGGIGGGVGVSSGVSPILRVVNHVAEELKASPVLASEVVRAADVWARMPIVVQRLSESSTGIIGGQWQREGASDKTGKSLIKHVLLQVEEFLYQENLTVEWASFPTQPTAAKAFPVKNAIGFHRVWSALSFLFCIVDGAGETATSSAGGEVPASATLISNEAEFGHGFTIAGCAIMHLLGQRAAFEVLDFSSNVLRLDAHEKKATSSAPSFAAAAASGSGGGVGAKVDQSLVQETTSFVYSADTQKQLQKQLFTLFEVLHKTRDSYTKHSTNKMVFHPPAENI